MLSSFASESPSAWCHLTSRSKGMEARSGETPVWRCHNSDDWFRWTATVASAEAIQASCQATAVQKSYTSQKVVRFIVQLSLRLPAPKICDSLISCAAHKK